MSDARKWIPASLAVLAAAAPVPAQSTLGTLPGDPATGYATAVATAGDVNHDGFDDVVLGEPEAPGGGTERGRVVVLSGRDGALLHEAFGDADFHRLGFSVGGAGDVNMDGYADFVAGAFGGNLARVFSGFDGTVIATYTTTQNGDLLGHGVAGAGDVNGDGYDDVIVGSNRLIVFAPGFATVFSGLDGSVLHTFGGTSLLDGFGNAVAGGGDADDDGVPDLIVGGPQDDLGGSDAGAVRVYSGATGAMLHEFLGDAADDQLGVSVAFVGDVDGDGHDDVAGGAPGCGVSAFCSDFEGYVRVYSGDTGDELHTFRGRTGFESYGVSVSGAGDVDGDGRGDVLIGAVNADDRVRTDNGRVELRSGATGGLILSADGDAAGDGLGASVGGGGDYNGDGVPDLLAGSLSGYARTGSLRLGRSAHTLSLTAGGEQALSLVAGPAFAGMPFALLGTAGGTSPGLKVGGAVLPLNLGTLNPPSGALLTQAVFQGLSFGEPRWLRSLVAPGPNVSPLAVRVGYLDAFGEARAAVSIAPGAFPALAGTTLHHAYLVFDPVAQRAILASNAVALSLTR